MKRFTTTGLCVLRAIALMLLAAGTARAETAPNASLIAQGEYLARAGDCMACHTTPAGRPFAGGLGLATPIGTVYSSNITPDPTAGIGRWTYEDFATLMRTGVTKAGHTVYPAMPYPSYSRLSDADLRALYAYFQFGVKAQPTPNRKADIPWPLSLRFPLAAWRKAFAPVPVPMNAAAAAVPSRERGAYLVQGLGHCGACHTPHGLAFQEKALSDAGNEIYLAGGAPVDGWAVPSLRNEHGGGLAAWNTDDVVEYLKTGRNQHSAAFGGMSDVVRHSTQHLSDADLSSIALYLKSLPPGAPMAAAYVPDARTGKALAQGVVEGRGAQVYLDRCAGCHRSDGQGNGKAFPALAGNAVLQTRDATSAIRIVLSGAAVPGTRSAPSSLTMAPYAALLDDAQVADVVSFIQTGWGNQGGAAKAEQVATIRKTVRPLQPPTEASFARGR